MAADRTATDPRRGGPAGADAVLPERVVVWLLAVLSAAAGGLDVVCVTQFGGVFASVITGNLVQLGRATAIVDGRLVVAATIAVGSYALGVAVGTVGLRGGAGWHRRTSLVVAVEVVLLTGVAAGWLATGAHPGRTATSLLLALASAAMGVQSAVTIGSGVRDASTTYLTGTLTNMVRTLVAEPHRFAGTAGSAARLAALVCGAAIGAVVLRAAPLWAPAVPAALVAAVVVIAAVRSRGRMEER